jgi:hypothetical protein
MYNNLVRQFTGREEIIGLDSASVTKFNHIANYEVPLIEIRTPNGVDYLYDGDLYVRAKLKADGGAEIPVNSTLYLYKVRDGEDIKIPLGKIQYSRYYGLGVDRQQSRDFIPQLTWKLTGVDGVIPFVSNPQGHKLLVTCLSSVAVDLTEAGSLLEFVVGVR